MKKSELAKSLYRAVMKAMDVPGDKAQTVKRIIQDIQDPNMQAQVPKTDIPATKQSVLHKEADMNKMTGTPMMVSEHEKGVHKLKKFMEKCAMKKQEKGVHLPIAARTPQGAKESPAGRPDTKSPSLAGIMAGRAKTGKDPVKTIAGAQARTLHEQNLKELKSMPKPNLPKSEKGSK